MNAERRISSSTGKWVLDDAIKQVRDIAIIKYKLTDKKEDEKVECVSPTIIARMRNIDVKDLNKSLDLLQQWLIKFADRSTNIRAVCMEMLSIAREFEAMDRPIVLSKKEALKRLPHKHDKKEYIDDIRGDSPTFLVLDTLVKMLDHLNQDAAKRTLLARRRAIAQGQAVPAPLLAPLEKTPISLIDFAYIKLHHSYPAPIRNVASRVIAALSNHHITHIVKTFSNELKTVAGHDVKEREFVTKQRAVKLFTFNLETKTTCTIEYLGALVDALKKCTRGVLREELCATILSIFQQILDPKDSRKIHGLNKLLNTESAQAELMWQYFDTSYALVFKLARKDRYAYFSLEYLWKAACVSNPRFYANPNRGDFLKLILNGLGRSKHRQHSLEMLKGFLKNVPNTFVSVSIKDFTSKMKIVKNKLYNKYIPKPEEEEILTDILEALGRCYLFFAVNEVMVTVLNKKAGYPHEMKAIILKALSRLSKSKEENNHNCPANMKTYLLKLGPALSPYIEERDECMVMSAALQCFPAVRHPDKQQAQITAEAIVKLTLDSDREVSASASDALRRYILLDPEIRMVETMFNFCDMACNWSLTPAGLLKLCHNISFFLTSLDQDLKNNKTPFRQLNAWLTVRQHLQAVFLFWVSHPQAWVRAEVLRMLHQTSRQVLHPLESRIMGALKETEAQAGRFLSTEKAANISLPKHLAEWSEVEANPDFGLAAYVENMAKSATVERKKAEARPSDYLSLYFPEVHDMSGADAEAEMEASALRGELLHPALVAVLTTHYDRFAGCITWAFSRSFTRIYDHLEGRAANKGGVVKLPKSYSKATISGEAAWRLWKRHIRLACLSVRPPHGMKDEKEDSKHQTVGLYDSMVKQAKDAAVALRASNLIGQIEDTDPDRNIRVASTDMSNMRPALDHLTMSQAQIDSFFEECVRILHFECERTPDRKMWPKHHKEAQAELAESLSRVDPSVYANLLTYLQKPAEDASLLPAITKKRRASRRSSNLGIITTQGGEIVSLEDPRMKLLYHEPTLFVLAKLFQIVTPAQFHSVSGPGPSLRRCLDRIVLGWVHEDERAFHDIPSSIQCRAHMAVLTSRYLYFATHPAPEGPEEDQECRAAPGEESIFSQEKKMDEVGDEKLPSKKDENGDETKNSKESNTREHKKNETKKKVTSERAKMKLRSGSEKIVESEDVVKLRLKFLDFLSGERILPFTIEDLFDEENMKIEKFKKWVMIAETSLAEAARSLAAAGAFKDTSVEDKLLAFLHVMPYRGRHVDTPVREAFRFLLDFNSKQLRHFTRGSSPEVWADEEARMNEIDTGSKAIDQEKLLINKNTEGRAYGVKVKRRIWLFHKYQTKESINGSDVLNFRSRKSHWGSMLALNESDVLKSQGHLMLDVESSAVARSTAARIALFYFEAIVDLLEEQPSRWLIPIDADEMARDGNTINEEGKFHPTGAMLLSLIHQANPNGYSRTAALKLAAILASHNPNGKEGGVIDPGYPVHLHSHQSPFMYSLAALEYSNALAKIPKYQELLNRILTSMVAISDYVSPRVQELLLRALTPWVQHFGRLLALAEKKDTTCTRRLAQGILGSLHKISRSCRRSSSLLGHLLFEVWITILSPPRALTIRELRYFFLTTYGQARALEFEGKTSSDRQRGREDKATLKTVAVHICRSEEGKLIVDSLMSALRAYPQGANKDQMMASEEPSGTEVAAFELAIDLLFENGLRWFLPHIPLLLQNAVVLFGGTNEGHDMVHCVAMVLWSIQDQKLSCKSPMEGTSIGGGVKVSLSAFIRLLRTNYRQLHSAWTQISLEWATRAKDQRVSSRSFRLFQRLRTRYVGPRALPILIMAFHKSLRDKEYEKVTELVYVFKLPSSHWDIEGWQTLIGCAIVLLRSSENRLFSLGLDLMLALLIVDGGNDDVELDEAQLRERAVRQEWLKQLENIWIDEEEKKKYVEAKKAKSEYNTIDKSEVPMNVEEEFKMSRHTIDFIIAGTLLKGFYGPPRTAGGSWAVLLYMADTYRSELPANNNMVLLLLLASGMRAIGELLMAAEHKEEGDYGFHSGTLPWGQENEVFAGVAAKKAAAEHATRRARRRGALQRMCAQAADLAAKHSSGKLEMQVNSVVQNLRLFSEALACAGVSGPGAIWVEQEGLDTSGGQGERDADELWGALRLMGLSGDDNQKSACNDEKVHDTKETNLQPKEKFESKETALKMTGQSNDARETMDLAVREYMARVCRLCSTRMEYDYMVLYFTRQLEFGGVKSTRANLRMLHSLLMYSSHDLTAQQFEQIADLMVRHCYSDDHEVKILAETLAQDMVKITSEDAIPRRTMFNFIRSKPRPRVLKVDNDTIALLMTTTLSSNEHSRVLHDFKKKVFPLVHRLENINQLEREAEGEGEDTKEVDVVLDMNDEDEDDEIEQEKTYKRYIKAKLENEKSKKVVDPSVSTKPKEPKEPMNTNDDLDDMDEDEDILEHKQNATPKQEIDNDMAFLTPQLRELLSTIKKDNNEKVEEPKDEVKKTKETKTSDEDTPQKSVEESKKEPTEETKTNEPKSGETAPSVEEIKSAGLEVNEEEAEQLKNVQQALEEQDEAGEPFTTDGKPDAIEE